MYGRPPKVPTSPTVGSSVWSCQRRSSPASSAFDLTTVPSSIKWDPAPIAASLVMTSRTAWARSRISPPLTPIWLCKLQFHPT